MARKGRAEKRKVNKLYNFDFTLLCIVIFILAFGLVMLYSTSAYAATIHYNNDSLYFLKKQLFASALGFAAMIVFTFLDYNIIKRFAKYIYIAATLACGLVLFFGEEVNGSRRWFKVFGVSVQPSEVAKVAVVIFYAWLISNASKSLRSFKSCLKSLIFVTPILIFVGLNNLSTAIIILGIACIMIFVASPHIWQYAVALLAGGVLIAATIPLVGYRMSRIDAWQHPENYITGSGFQTLQALYAIGSGGIFGKGLGGSMQKYIVPEAENDMIFSIICEELGIFAAICLIVMYLLLIYRLLFIANHAEDMFASFLCIGIMAHIALQVILNIAVVTNTIPNTGVTLPFISYGGTSTSILLGEIGIALGVSRRTDYGNIMADE